MEFPIRDLLGMSLHADKDVQFTSAMEDINKVLANPGLPWQKEKDIPFLSVFHFTGYIWDL
jgi:hypothetical protein